MRLARLASVVCVVLAAGSARAEEIDNPEFASWSKFKKGTVVTLKTSSTAANVTSEISVTSTLVEVGADKVVVETTSVSTFNGMEFKSPAVKREITKTLKLPAGVKKDDFKGGKPPGTTKEGTETVKIGGTEYKTKWFEYTNEVAGNKTEAKMWTSDDVPGTMVKMESKTTGTVTATVKMELVEIKKP